MVSAAKTGERATVVAVAGRRVDAPGAPARFPSSHEGAVRERMRRVFGSRRVHALVSSAACGADLIGLEVAGELRIRRVVVLPQNRATFRERSVADRGVHWAARFDRVIDDVDRRHDLRILELPDDGDEVYRATNEAVLTIAVALSRESAPPALTLAVVVWDGHSRGDEDLTDHFKRTAESQGLEVIEISTV